uniref:Uncharacterized protein n=1 Tax=Arundo donax TaxID=35708 RepID=A0A0A9FKZ0_ARUDO
MTLVICTNALKCVCIRDISFESFVNVPPQVHTCTEFVDLSHTAGLEAIDLACQMLDWSLDNRSCVSNVCLEFGQPESCEVPSNAVALTHRCFPILGRCIIFCNFFP